MHIQDAPLLEPGRHSKGAAAESYFDGSANGLEAILALIAQRRQEGLRIEVGFDTRKGNLGEQTIESLASRKWKWRDPDRNAGTRRPRNWIDATEFERVIERLRREETAD